MATYGLGCRHGRTLAGGSAGTGGGISAGVAGWVDDGRSRGTGTAYVGPSSIQSGTGINNASVGCTEGGGGRLVGIYFHPVLVVVAQLHNGTRSVP